MAVLQDLAPELVDAILLFILPRQLLDIRLCSRWFNDFISRSSLAQYRLECWALGVVDKSLHRMSYPERLNVMRRREEAWHTLDVRKRYDLQVPLLSCRTFDLTEGMLSFEDPEGLQIQTHQQSQTRPEGYATLMLRDGSPTEAAGQSWVHNALPEELAEYAFSVRDLDLAAALTSKRVSDQPGVVINMPDEEIQIAMHSFDLNLRSITLGDYHPSARQPIIRVCDRFPVVFRPRSFVQVAGEYVLIMLVHQDLPTLATDDFDILYFVHWRSGAVHEVARFPTLQYQGFVFLQADVLLFCNLRTTALDVFAIKYGTTTNEPPSLRLSCSLMLPFPEGLSNYQCRAEPNVNFPNPGPMANPPPVEGTFSDDPEHAIVLFYLTFFAVSCTLVVHRHKLLAAATDGTSDPMQPIEYETWGRNICGWMNEGGAWITQAQGQRFVTTSPIWNPEAENEMDAMWSMVHVYDFNPHTVRRVLREIGRNGKKELPNGNLVEVQLTKWVHMENVPRMRLETRLPYVKTSLKDLVPYEDVMLDGDYILGIYPPENGQWTLAEIEVLAIG